MDELKQKYLEYKDKLQKIEDGDEETLRETSIYRYDMMRSIVFELENQGFHLICKIN